MSNLQESDTIEGIIYKLLGGIYYVNTAKGSFACKARGLFRLNGTKPLVGDRVIIEPDQYSDDEAFITQLLKRRNQLVRPPVANVDQAIIVVATEKPKPNIHLLDKMLLSCEIAGVKPVIVINKSDLTNDICPLIDIYIETGYKLVLTSALQSRRIEQVTALLEDRVSVFAGASGVGKSSLLNAIIPNLGLKTGVVSKKIERGKHTTRHTELIALPQGGYVLDTPGFTSLDISGISKYQLADYFPDIEKYAGGCRFQDCLHIKEPNCAVRAAIEQNKIHLSRYKSYQMILNQLENERV